MINTQTTEDQGSALESEIWIQLKAASVAAHCCDATIRRAIKSGKITGRKVSEARNASCEVSKASFDEWLAKRGTKKIDKVQQVAPTEQSGQSGQTTSNNHGNTTGKPKLSKVERRKLKTARKKEIPESARRLRRWKNFMRPASQEQALAMIKWLSARLTSNKSLQQRILKEAPKPDETNSKPAS